MTRDELATRISTHMLRDADPDHLLHAISIFGDLDHLIDAHLHDMRDDHPTDDGLPDDSPNLHDMYQSLSDEDADWVFDRIASDHRKVINP